MQRVAPDIYFPLEVVKREYAGHLFVGTELASRGFNILIGPKSRLKQIARFAKRPGLVYYKNDVREPFRSLGFIGAGQDPEVGAAYGEYARFYSDRPDLKNIGESEAYFCYGNEDRDFLARTHPEFAHKLHLTGSPRVFTWTQECEGFYIDDIRAIREHYGKFVLFCSAESLGNPRGKPLEDVPDWFQYIAPPGMDLPAAWSRHVEDSKIRARGFREAALRVAQRGHNVVIRPHPSEGWEFYTSVARETPNLHVDAAADLSPWVRTADVVVQNGSTSALEAHFAGTPVIAYASSHDEFLSGYKSRLGTVIDLVAAQAVGIESLLESIDALIAAGESNSVPPETSDEMQRKFFEHPLGAPKAVADVISQIPQFGGESGLPPQSSSAGYRRYLDRMSKSLATMSSEEDRIGTQQPSHGKIRPIRRDAVVRDIDRAKSILNLEERLNVCELLDSCFLIRRS